MKPWHRRGKHMPNDPAADQVGRRWGTKLPKPKREKPKHRRKRGTE